MRLKDKFLRNDKFSPRHTGEGNKRGEVLCSRADCKPTMRAAARAPTGSATETILFTLWQLIKFEKPGFPEYIFSLKSGGTETSRCFYEIF